MTLLDVVLIALIEGIAEVLPLGAPGHLVIFGRLAADAEARQAVIVAAEIGIVLALMLYFWRDLFAMGRSTVRLAKGRMDSGGRLLLQVLTGTVPALALMWAASHLGGTTVAPAVAAGAMIVFGLLLWIADRLGVTVRRVEHLGWIGAAVIGALQAAAILPGISRTAITIAAARLMGFERRDAARFSLLLAIPLLGAQAGQTLWHLSQQTRLILSSDLALTTGLSLLAAWLSTVLMLAWVERRGYGLFAAWPVGLGLVVLAASVLR